MLAELLNVPLERDVKKSDPYSEAGDTLGHEPSVRKYRAGNRRSRLTVNAPFSPILRRRCTVNVADSLAVVLLWALDLLRNAKVRGHPLDIQAALVYRTGFAKRLSKNSVSAKPSTLLLCDRK